MAQAQVGESLPLPMEADSEQAQVDSLPELALELHGVERLALQPQGLEMEPRQLEMEAAAPPEPGVAPSPGPNSAILLFFW